MKTLLSLLAVPLLIALSVPADAGQKLRACRGKVETLTAIVLAEVDEDCIPSGTDYWLRLCPQDCWRLDDFATLSQVCCNPYGSDDGIPDGSCVTRSAR